MSDQLRKELDEAIDRLKSAHTPFDLEKAIAIAELVKLKIEVANE
jgi:hypothetical protein